MTTNDFPDPEKIFERLLTSHPVVEQASTSISDMYKMVIPELAKQINANLEKHAESAKIHEAVDEMTVDMINKMNSRIAKILGDS